MVRAQPPAPTFRAVPLPERRFLVVNYSPNHHGISQYLSSAPVRTAVTALLA